MAPAEISRRSFGRLMLGGMAAYSMLAKATPSGSRLVDVGLHSYSLRTIPREGAIETIIAAMQQVNLKHLELWEQHVAPASTMVSSSSLARMSPQQVEARKQAATEALTSWRRTVNPEFFAEIGQRFRAAGITVRGYNVRLGETPEEIDRLFVMAKALGVEALCARVPLPMTSVVATLAEKHRMIFGVQSVDAEAMSRQMPQSKFFRIDLDIGDFTKAGHDALAFVKENYTRITDIHLKDCVLNGPSVPFGTGDSHMAEILQFVAAKRPSIQTYIDCDYPGTGQSVEEIRKCYGFVQRSLHSVASPV